MVKGVVLSDDAYYGIFILLHFVFGFLFRKIDGILMRRYLPSILGYCSLFLLCGRDCIHFVVLVLGNCLLHLIPELSRYGFL